MGGGAADAVVVQEAGTYPTPPADTKRKTRAAKRKSTKAEIAERLRSTNIGRLRERKAKEDALEGKAKAEALAAKHKRKVGELSDTVRALKQGTRIAKKSLSKAEKEHKEVVSAMEAQHDKDIKAIEVEMTALAAELGVRC